MLFIKRDIRRAFGQQDPNLDPLVPDALGHLRALEERHLEHIPLDPAHVPLAQKSRQIGVPPDAETILPPAEDGIARADLEVGLAGVAAEATRRDVADVVCKVRV